MYDFDFIRPATIDAAVEALKDEDAPALGGGARGGKVEVARLPRARVHCADPDGVHAWRPSW